MADSPMIIMWSNSDGSVTLSQRQASGEVEPAVVSAPPRVATLDESATSLEGDVKFGYTIPVSSFGSRVSSFLFLVFLCFCVDCDHTH